MGPANASILAGHPPAGRVCGKLIDVQRASKYNEAPPVNSRREWPIKGATAWTTIPCRRFAAS